MQWLQAGAKWLLNELTMVVGIQTWHHVLLALLVPDLSHLLPNLAGSGQVYSYEEPDGRKNDGMQMKRRVIVRAGLL